MNQETSKNTTFFRFEDLRVYNKAVDFAFYVSELCNKVYQNETSTDSHFLCNYVEIADTIALHIAEGSSNDKALFVQCLKTAKIAIRQCIVYTTLAVKKNFINAKDEKELRNQLMELTKMIGALITSLQKNEVAQEKQIDEDIDGLNW